MSRIGSSLTATLFAGASVLLATPAMASTVGFDLTINDPVFNSASGLQNVPDFQLTNTTDPSLGIQITSFDMTIGDTSFNYDFVRIENVVTDSGDALVSNLLTVGTVNNGVGDDILSYTFSGFDAGDVFQFEVDVDPDTGGPWADFRNALFPNGSVSVTFSNGAVLSQDFTNANSSDTSFQFDSVAVVPLPATLPLLLPAGLFGGAVLRRARRS